MDMIYTLCFLISISLFGGTPSKESPEEIHTKYTHTDSHLNGEKKWDKEGVYENLITSKKDRDRKNLISDRTNNYDTQTHSTYPPNLKVINANTTSSSSTVYPGQTIIVNCIVKNIGYGSSTISSVEYAYSHDDILHDFDADLGSNIVSALTPNETSNESRIITIPLTASSGIRYIFFKVDENDQLQESNENDNIYSIEITVESPSSNLLVSAASISDYTLYSGQENIEINSSIANDGTGTAGYSLVTYYYSEDDVLNLSEDVFLGASPVSSLVSNATSDVSEDVTIPSTANAGTRYIFIKADGNNDVVESNENDNVYTPIPITIHYTPTFTNLIVENTTANPNTISPNESITVSCDVKNGGTGNTGTSALQYWYSSDLTLDGTDTFLGSELVESLSSNQVSSRTRTFILPFSIQLGAAHILFKADANNTITESNENDNIGSVPITVVCDEPTSIFSASNGINNIDVLEGTTITFSANNPDINTNLKWYINGTLVGTGISVTYTFNSVGSREVVLEASNNCDTSQSSLVYYGIQPKQTSVVDDERANSIEFVNYEAGDPVNMRSGAFVRTQHIMNIRSINQDFPFNLDYRSDMNYTGIFGRNISFTYGYNLDMSDQDKFKIRHPNGSITTYARYEDDSAVPMYYGITDTLYKSGNYYFLKAKNSSRVQFRVSDGKCVTIRDRHNHVVRLSYLSDGRLFKISTPGWRDYFLDYTNGYVTTIRDNCSVPRQAAITYSGSNITSITNVRGETSQFQYQNNLMTKVIDAKNIVVIENTYQAGRVVHQKDALGNEYLFDTPTSFPSIATVTFPNGQIERVCYDAHKHPCVFEDNEGYKDSIVYNDWHLPLEYYDKKGNKILSYVYEEGYRPIKIIDAYNDTTKLIYGVHDVVERLHLPTGEIVDVTLDGYGNPTNVLLPNNTNISSVFNAFGQLISRTDVRQTTTSYGYDGDGNTNQITTPTGLVGIQHTEAGFTSSMTDRNNQSVAFALNAFGKMTGWTDSKLESSTMEYCANGNPIKYTDREGTEYGATYNAKNQLISTTVNGNTKATYTWDNLDRYTSTSDANGNLKESIVYDMRGLVVQQFDGVGWYTFDHDENGRVISIEDPLSNVWTMERDIGGRVTKTYAPNGDILSEVLFDEGRVKQIKDGKGYTKTIDYDVLGRVQKVEDAKGGKNTLTSNDVGDIVSLQNTNNETFQFIRNELGMPETIIFPGNDTYTITYGNEGEILGYKDANNLESTLTYDANYNPTNITYTNGNTYVFGYDKEDRPLTISKNGETTTFTRNEVGLPATTQGRFGYSVGYGYNDNYQTETITYPDGLEVTYEYFPNGILKKVLDNQGHSQEYQIDVLGRYTTKTNSNGTSVAISRNSNGQVLAYVNTYPDGTILYADSLTYDKNGNTTKTKRINQLSPDFGALLDVTDSYSYGDADKQTQTGFTASWTRTFDGNGAVLTESNGTINNIFTYIENDMCSGANFNGHTITNQYNGLQMRDARTIDGVTTKYVLDARNNVMPYILEERDNGGNLLRSYVYGNGRLLWMVENTDTYFYHFDKVGHTRAITNENAALVQRYGMDVFGGYLNEETSFEQPFIFMGEYGVVQDVKGLINVRKRYYSTQSFRFLQRDPYPWDIFNTQSVNRYTYALNNPLSFIDPTGYVSGDENDISGRTVTITNNNGDELFSLLTDGELGGKTITAKNLYDRGLQWFEPTANSYIELLSVSEDIRTTSSVRHFTWDEIAEFAETERPNHQYYPGLSGDWTISSEGARGYYLVEIDGTPYWADAIGQIPYSVDVFTDKLRTTGNIDEASFFTIVVGQRFGSRTSSKSDRTNNYDNAMIKRTIDWASQRYKLGDQPYKPYSNSYNLIQTNYSPSNLSFR